MQFFRAHNLIQPIPTASRKSMPRFDLIDAKIWHCGQMCRRLRSQHAIAVAGLDIEPHMQLRTLFDDSAYRKAWLIDGELAALGGVTGTSMSTWGYVWLAITDKAAAKHKFAIVREARRQLALLMTTRHELATTIIGGDEAAKRLAVFLGFHVAHEGRGSPATSRYGRRTLQEFLDSEPDLRIPVGAGYAIAMGYHREEAA
jgi:hypothetical protein